MGEANRHIARRRVTGHVGSDGDQEIYPRGMTGAEGDLGGEVASGSRKRKINPNVVKRDLGYR